MALPSPYSCRATMPHQVKRELFDRASDPDEATNLAQRPAYEDTIRTLEADLDEWWSQSAGAADESDDTEVEIDERVVQRLRDLGYLD